MASYDVILAVPLRVRVHGQEHPDQALSQARRELVQVVDALKLPRAYDYPTRALETRQVDP